MNGYELSRYWFDWAFENPDLINPNDTALYLWLVEKNNRCGWSEKFSVTAAESMGACGFKTYPPYKKSFDRLVEFGFIIIVKKAINQHQSNVIALSKNDKAIVKALDKAHLNQSKKHIDSSSESTFDINKQDNYKTDNTKTDKEQDTFTWGDGVLELMCNEFKKQNPNKYPDAMYENFLEYWTAPLQTRGKKGKEQWRDEKTFQLSARLRTSYDMIWSKKIKVANTVTDKRLADNIRHGIPVN